MMVSPRKTSRQQSLPPTKRTVILILVAAIGFFLLYRQEDAVQHALLDSTFPTKKKIAILVGGSFSRYLLNSTLHHVLTPLTRDEHYEVDYFVLLTTPQNTPPPYRADLEYMNHVRWDPIFGDTLPSQQEIDDRIHDLVKNTGATLRSLRLLESLNITDDRLEQRRKEALARNPNEDVDLRFPMKDLRPNALSRTANGNRNMLNLFYGIQLLWDDVVAAEVESTSKYDYVMIFRDDTLWLQDFSLDKLLRSSTDDADTFVLSCNAREPPMLPPEINDHAIIVSREKAHVLGRYYTSLFDADLEACGEAVKNHMGDKRGCNSEMILRWILNENEIQVQEVPQSLIPFQRSVTVEWNGQVFPCFHKYCQSKEDPLVVDPSLKKCKSLTF